MLPEGWIEVTLGSVAKITTGGTPSRSIPEYWGGEIPWMSSGEINQRVIRGVAERITFAGMANSNARLLAPDTIMMALNGQGKTRGKVAILKIETTCNQSLAGIIPNQELVKPDYLFQYLDSIYKSIRNLTGDDARNGLNLKILGSISVPLPPLDEQERIAEVLRSVDKTIALTKTAAEQAGRAIEGMLQRLFVEGVGHADFKDGHSTSIPASWSEKSLGNLSAVPITYGVVQPGPNFADGVPFVRGGDFPNGKIDLGALRKIGKDVASQYRRTQLRGGEIVVSLVGYPGACAIVPDALAGANIARQAALIRPKAEIDTNYLYQFLRSPIGQARLKNETIGSAQQVINLRDLKEVMVAVPPKREQEQIAAILTDLDAFVELETANLDKLATLKTHLMSDLLRGRVPT
jgi:type I restriction enzyme S subunit